MTKAIEKVRKEIKKQKSEWIDFYRVYESEKKGISIAFKPLPMVAILKSLGVYRYTIGDQNKILIIKDNIAREVKQFDVIDLFEDWLTSMANTNGYLPDESKTHIDLVMNKLYNGMARYFSPHIIDRCRPDKEIKFNEHTKNKAFFYYKNGYVEVSEFGIKLKPYHQLDKIIWESQILDREFKVVDPSQPFPFLDFFNNVCGNNKGDAKDRVKALRTALGYVLHSHFESRDLKSINFTDSKIDEYSSGGTGKTLIALSLLAMLNKKHKIDKIGVMLNGKDFKGSDRFKYQKLSIATKLVVINDMVAGQNIEPFYNDITEGMEMQKKNEGVVDVRAKFIFISNEALALKGGSDKRRILEFEFADFYNEDLTPIKVHHEWFFADWDSGRWAQFDNLMLNCIVMYFKEGLLKAREINLGERKLLSETSMDFIQWMERQLSTGEIKHQTEYDRLELKARFIKDNDDYSNMTTSNFTKWIDKFCEVRHIIYDYQKIKKNSKTFLKFFIRKDDENTQEKLPF